MPCRYRLWKMVLPYLTLLALGAPARGDVVYQNSFETTAGAQWSSQVRDITPKGARRFLGKFGNNTVNLSLANLPSHTGLRISFDLFIIQYWTGNGAAYGPHRWDFGVGNGPALLHTTFSNDAQPQAYPGQYPEVNNPARTGAVEKNSLGYPESGDSVYHLAFDIYHTDPSVVFRFVGSQLNGLPATHWGLDNVKVETISMGKPMPSRDNLVTNGDFEIPIVPGGNLITMNALSEAIVGWTVSDGSVDLNGEHWQNARGRQSLDMSGLDRAGTIYQDIPAQPGKSYRLDFQLAGNPGGQPVKYLEVWWGDTRVDTAQFNVTGKTLQDMGWVRKEYLVTTPTDAGATTRLKLVSLNQDSFGPAIDLVRVVPAVPGDFIINGEFEYPALTGDRTTYAIYDTFEYWTVFGGSVQQVSDWQAAAGRTSVHLNGTEPGTLVQPVQGLKDGTYLLRYSMSGDPEGGPSVRAMDVLWDSRVVARPTFDTTGHTKSAMGWTPHAVLVAGPADGSASLVFQSRTPGSFGPAVDSVSLAPAVAGDTNMDGRVTVADAVEALRIVTGMGASEAGTAALADIAPRAGVDGRLHGDGVHDLEDVRAILNLASGIEAIDRPQIRDRYREMQTAMEAEHIDSVMTLFSPDYLDSGYNYIDLRHNLASLFDQYDIEKVGYTIHDILVAGDSATAIVDEQITGYDTWDNNVLKEIVSQYTDIWRYTEGNWFLYGNQSSTASAMMPPVRKTPRIPRAVTAAK